MHRLPDPWYRPRAILGADLSRTGGYDGGLQLASGSNMGADGMGAVAYAECFW